jgi:hypothetical protein
VHVDHEIISRVEILPAGEIILILKSGGKRSYQYIFREGKGVYWDMELNGFKSTVPTSWTYPEWFMNIVSTAEICCTPLRLSSDTNWKNIPDSVRDEIISVMNAYETK